MDSPLVVYYSFSGTTRALAGQIARLTGGHLRELIPERPYAFDFNAASKEVRNEIARGYCPVLLSGNESIHDYNTIYIGTPNWFKSIAPPVLAFLRRHDFSGKTVALFCTHGGGGLGEIEKRMAEECPGANMLPGLAIAGVAEDAQITDWFKPYF